MSSIPNSTGIRMSPSTAEPSENQLPSTHPGARQFFFLHALAPRQSGFFLLQPPAPYRLATPRHTALPPLPAPLLALSQILTILHNFLQNIPFSLPLRGAKEPCGKGERKKSKPARESCVLALFASRGAVACGSRGALLRFACAPVPSGERTPFAAALPYGSEMPSTTIPAKATKMAR